MEQEKVITSYKDLIVWQKSIRLVIEVYVLTEKYPKEEEYGLKLHTRKTAVSIPSNIAEGRGRSTKKDFCNFLRVALGSANELETQIIIAKNLPKTKNFDYSTVDGLLIEVIKMLTSIINKFKASS
jgi:four helix bundle protein